MKKQMNQYTKNLEWHKRVYLAITCGVPISTLAKNLGVCSNTINRSYMDFFSIFDKEKGTIALGNKNDAYFTESEMLNGFTVSVSELSKSELAYLESL